MCIKLSIPRLRRAGSGFETGPGRGPGDRALCHGAGADGRAAGSVRESATAGREGREGAYGFYEAVDYTPSRLPPDETQRHRPFLHGASSGDEPAGARLVCCATSRCSAASCRAHCSRRPICCCRSGCPKRRPAFCPKISSWKKSRPRFGEGEDVMRVFTNPTSRTPEVHLLSNGRYHVAISNAGGGYSRWRDLAVTRWREDATRDCWGTFIYLRDVATGEFWSAAYQPTLRATKSYEAIFTQARAEFRQRHGDSRCTPRSASRRKTTSSCGASRSPIIPHARARSN